MLVGLDEQLLRATPRAEILVQRSKTVRGLSSQGGTLTVGLPDDPVLLAGEAAGYADDDSPQSRTLVSSPETGEDPAK